MPQQIDPKYMEEIEKLKREIANMAGPADSITEDAIVIPISIIPMVIDRAASLGLLEGKRQQHEEVMQVVEERFKDLDGVEPRMDIERERRNEAQRTVRALASLSPGEEGKV